MVLGKGKNVVLFKPNEWRGSGDCDSQTGAAAATCRLNFKNATEMSNHINGFKPGTVISFYTASDGGMNMDLIYNTVKLLGDHVEIVNREVLVDMALAGHKASEAAVVV